MIETDYEMLEKNDKSRVSKLPRYSHIWFNPNNFAILNQFKQQDNIKFMEIGSFEGYSANYFIDNYLTGNNCHITCIDPWIKYSDSTIAKISDYDHVVNEETYMVFLHNTWHNKNKIIIRRDLSYDILPQLDNTYNFIYIDGDHSEQAVWLDAIYSFDKLVVNGLMIFDDYKWGSGEKSPEKAINKFIKEYNDHISILFVNDQVGIKKTSNLKLNIDETN